MTLTLTSHELATYYKRFVMLENHEIDFKIIMFGQTAPDICIGDGGHLGFVGLIGAGKIVT